MATRVFGEGNAEHRPQCCRTAEEQEVGVVLESNEEGKNVKRSFAAIKSFFMGVLLDEVFLISILLQHCWI